MLYVSLVASAIMLAVTNAVARHGTRAHLVSAGLAGAGFGMVGVACLISAAVALQGVLVLAVGLLCGWRLARPRTFLLGSVVATVLAYGLVGASALLDLWEWRRLEPLHPVESLEARLAYERPRPEPHPDLANAVDQQPTGRPPAVRMADLAPLDNRLQQANSAGARRTRALRILHGRHVEQFINSPGFGFVRDMRPRPGDVELGEARPVPQPAPARPDEERADEGADSYARALPGMNADQRPAAEALRKVHVNGFVDFLDPRRFGYVASRAQVTGFQPHQFTGVPDGPAPRPGNPRWRIERLELVSLLKHEEPAVYVSQNLPRMDELREAPTRPLDGFEQRALVGLRRGEDLQVEYFRDHLRMLGPLYALDECRRCHSAEKGELLGAFSYVLRPAP